MKGKKKNSYMRTLYLQFFLVLMSAAVAMNLVVVSYYAWRERKLMRDEKERQLEQGFFYMERILEEAGTVASGIWTSAEVQGVMKNSHEPTEYLLYRDCMEYLSKTISNLGAVAWADLYLSDSNILITSNDGVFYNLDEENERYYRQQTEKTNSEVWSMDYQEHFLSYFHRSRQVVTLIRPVYSTQNGRKKGILCVGIPISELYSYLDSGEEQGMLLSFGGKNLRSSSMDRDHFERWEGEDGISQRMSEAMADTYQYQYQGKRYTVLKRENTAIGFCVYVYFVEHPLLPGLLPLSVCVLAIILLFAVVYGVIVRISEKRMSRPVSVLVEAMREMENGTFGVKIEEERDDIFGEMFLSFNQMSGNLQRLVREVLEERLHKENFKYRLLQSQINPHFLYNIFNNMIWMTEQKDYERLEQMISATAGYYKTALNYGSDSICLSDNLRQLQCYAWIQQVRFADLFHCEFYFDEEILSFSIPNLILQPLVENAIVHGAQHKEGVTQIVVTGTLLDNWLCFEVWDNGAGIAPDTLKEIQEALREMSVDDKKYFALVNISRRLALRYHRKAVMEIDSVYGAWTKVILRMPGEENV